MCMALWAIMTSVRTWINSTAIRQHGQLQDFGRRSRKGKAMAQRRNGHRGGTKLLLLCKDDFAFLAESVQNLGKTEAGSQITLVKITRLLRGLECVSLNSSDWS